MGPHLTLQNIENEKAADFTMNPFSNGPFAEVEHLSKWLIMSKEKKKALLHNIAIVLCASHIRTTFDEHCTALVNEVNKNILSSIQRY